MVHGAGHFVAGEKQTAARLLAAEAVGVGVTGVGALALGISGASRYLAAPLIAGMVGGVGLFAISGLADLYGTLAPEGGTGSPMLTAPVVTAAFRGRAIRDPVQPYSSLYGPAFDVRWRAFRVSPSAWFSDVGDNRRLRATFGYRFLGPRTDHVATDGSFVDLVLGATHHHFGDAGFTMRGGEAAIAARLDLARVAPTLAGSFADGHAGVAMASYAYRATPSTDRDEVLLLGFGFGIYVGRAPAPWGELRAYYDHRRDDYAGGLVTKGLSSGPVGHFGAEATFFPTPRWGISIEGQMGAAYVAGLALLHRFETNAPRRTAQP